MDTVGRTAFLPKWIARILRNIFFSIIFDKTFEIDEILRSFTKNLSVVVKIGFYMSRGTFQYFFRKTLKFNISLERKAKMFWLVMWKRFHFDEKIQKQSVKSYVPGVWAMFVDYFCRNCFLRVQRNVLTENFFEKKFEELFFFLL